MRQQRRLETIINSRSTSSPSTGDDVYIWKGGNAGLVALSESHWKTELENAVTKCIREGDNMSTTISSYLLEISAGIVLIYHIIIYINSEIMNYLINFRHQLGFRL